MTRIFFHIIFHNLLTAAIIHFTLFRCTLSRPFFYFFNARGCAFTNTCFSLSFDICVYIAVVFRFSCPSNSCTLFRSAPLSNRCVAKVCLNVWGDIFCFSALFFNTSFTISSILFVDSWFFLLFTSRYWLFILSFL